MKNVKKSCYSFLFLFLMLFLMSSAMPVTTHAVTTKTDKYTVCKGLSKKATISKLSAGSTVKWKNSNTAVLKPLGTNKTSTSSSYSFKTMKVSSGTSLTAYIYDKKGKLIKKEIFKIKVVNHTYKTTKKATCKAAGTKTCTVCGKKASIAKKAHTYAWVLDEKGIITENTEIVYNSSSVDTMTTEYRPQEKFVFYDRHYCSGRGEYCNGTYSDMISQFTMPQKTVKAGQKLKVTVCAELLGYHDTDRGYAQGGTSSGLHTLDNKISLNDSIEADYDNRWYNTVAKGYENETFLAFGNGAFPYVKKVEETYEYEMPKGKSVGQVKYVVMQSFVIPECKNGIRHWLPYKWKATCH